MGWGFVWLMLVLKIPIAALLYIVWWAIKQEEPAPGTSGEGGTKAPPHPHPRRPLPRSPRRGPHGEPPVPAPARTRTVVARASETRP
jgi:hypothetical protein